MLDPRTGRQTTTKEEVLRLLPNVLHLDWERLQDEWDCPIKLRKFKEDIVNDICVLRKYSGEKSFIFRKVGEQISRLRLAESSVDVRIRILEL